ncbi:uncharacterized protein LOC111636069 isoform X2 [Centruroides sculpturatus]|uniref:uncharacterized protein LOC111636069 isoform X2 n=1 Tax=Centruroides sculpturatus TaxID=218467 RepID=UPI000C6E3844|nr:uncharacterized protein LOC111636069 isoform X2 [Centruroides sculpturatus]
MEVIFLTGAIIASWALSSFTSIIYDSFINIGKYNSSILSPIYRFKIICFMKRFGGRPFGISVWGFFYVKRNFLIRVVSGFYSVLSSLIELTGALQNKRCSAKSSLNYTFKNETNN